MLTRQDNYIDMCTYYSTLLTLGTLIINKCSIRCLQMVDNSTEKGGYNMVEFSTTFLVVGKFHHIISTFFCGIIHHPRAGGKFFHHLQAGGKNFHHLEAGGNIPPFLVEIFPPSASRWKFFPPYASRWENSTKKGGCGMVEFFHPCIDGGKIPPCRWRFWTTFIGGIFHHIRLQCIKLTTDTSRFKHLLKTHLFHLVF